MLPSSGRNSLAWERLERGAWGPQPWGWGHPPAPWAALGDPLPGVLQETSVFISKPQPQPGCDGQHKTTQVTPASNALLKHNTQREDGKGVKVHWEGVRGSKLSLPRQEEDEELRCKQGPRSKDTPVPQDVPQDAHHGVPWLWDICSLSTSCLQKAKFQRVFISTGAARRGKNSPGSVQGRKIILAAVTQRHNSKCCIRGGR